MKKKILYVILLIFMLAAIFPTTASASGIVVKEIVSNLEYKDIGDFSEGLAYVWKDEKAGYINKSGELVIPCVYDSAYPFFNGLARVLIDEKESYIDKFGKNIITIEYDEVGDFSDGMAWLRKGDKYGYIDKSGELIIPMIYDAYDEDAREKNDYSIIENMQDFSEGLVVIKIDGKCGFINKAGKFVIPAIYDGDFWHGEWNSYIPKFDKGLVRVRKAGKYGYIDKTGKIAVPFEYDIAGDGHTGFFTEGLIRVGKYYYDEENSQYKCGFVDTSGNIVVPLEYYAVLEYSNGLAAVNYQYSEKWGFVDKIGKLILPIEYYIGDMWVRYSYFNEYGYIVVKREIKITYDSETVIQYNMEYEDGIIVEFGVIDRDGNLVVPYEYHEIQYFSDGLARVGVHKDAALGNYGGLSLGYVDKNFNIVVPLGEYDNIANYFSDGLAWAQKDDKYGYIDVTGELVVPLIYNNYYKCNFSEGLAAVKKDGKWSILEIENYIPQTGDSSGIKFGTFCFICTIILGLITIKILRIKTNKNI